jgi:antitoxin component YwqK of YwqJK toxin-antitoxin module
MSDLQVAEIPFEEGGIRYRYARKLSADGSRWIREGLFQAFHPNGTLATEGIYREGLEDGAWRDFHENGLLAAAGVYRDGKEAGPWQYWNADGSVEASR